MTRSGRNSGSNGGRNTAHGERSAERSIGRNAGRNAGRSTARGSGKPVTAARRVSQAMLEDLRSGMLLDASFEQRVSQLDPRDRRWVQQLVWTLLRTRERVDVILDRRIRGGITVLEDGVLDLLRLGVVQLLYMDSVPAYAAVGETVEAARQQYSHGAASLVNAVLRRVDRERDALELPSLSDPIEAMVLEFSHPAWQVRRWCERYGMESARALLEHNNTSAAVVIRPNGVKSSLLAQMLAGEGVETRSAKYVPDSLEIVGPVSLVELSAFRQGLFYVQDPAATLVTRYAHVSKGGVVADLCAAPGGKSLELAQRAKLVLAADQSRSRVARMRQGFARLDAGSDLTERILVLQADAARPAISPVDAVLLDVPCTGTGTYRRHPDARWRFQPSDLAVLASIQERILNEACRVVKPGGLLIYSTCSLEYEENDAQVEGFLAEHPEFSLEPPPPEVVGAGMLDDGRLRVLPWEHGSDGSFAARMRREI